MLTLSKQDWLDLPLYSFKDWKKVHTKTATTYNKETALRARTTDIAQYYKSYIEEVGIQDNFIDGVCVNQVKQVSTCSSTTESATPTSETTPIELSPTMPVGISSEGDVTHCPRCCCDRGVSCPTIIQSTTEWIVTGYTCCRAKFERETTLTVRAKKLVLACGLSKPKRLQVSGEELNFVLHDMSQLRSKSHHLKVSNKPILVIGAGMSAADAILFALGQEIQVYHAFYQNLDDAFIFNKLPDGLYEEYHKIWYLMQGLVTSPFYTPLKQHRVKSFLSNGSCILSDSTDSLLTLSIAAAVVMVGSQANLDFLPDTVKSSLGIESGLPIDSKHNPLDVNVFTSQSERLPNLYALGPLVGDHFVRFVFGSGLACAKDILVNEQN